MIGFTSIFPFLGCARGGPGPLGMVAHSVRPPHDSTGPYRDIDPAVRYAAPRVDMAIIEADASDPTHWRYALLTLRDEIVLLEIHLPADPDPSVPARPTAITATVGEFGNPRLERDLIRQVEDRLAALRKTGIAPASDAE